MSDIVDDSAVTEGEGNQAGLLPAARLHDLLVRGFTKNDLERLDTAASASGASSRNEWARRALLKAAFAPIVRKKFALRALAANGATISIYRFDDNPITGIEYGRSMCSPEQEELFQQIVKLVERNDPGDREKCIGMLYEGGFEVYEVPTPTV